MKRLNREWGDLESLVLSDTTDGMMSQGRGGGLHFFQLGLDRTKKKSCVFSGCLTVYLSVVLPLGFISNLTIQRQYFPTDEDQTGAAKALLRLQDTYKLDSNTISVGDLPGDDSQSASLSISLFLS